MKKILFGILILLYSVLLSGLILHTSSHPQILGKYTTFYVVGVVTLIISFYPIKLFLNWLFFLSMVRFGRKQVLFSPYKKILIVILCFLLFFLLPVELILRQKYKNVETESYSYTLDNFHPYLQARLSTHDNLHINSFGFRAEDIQKQKPLGTFRIFLLGGSTVLNAEVPYEKSAGRILEKRLQTNYPDIHIEVINAGKDWYTSEHSLIQYIFSIREFQPDVIIMWHGINDLFQSCVPDNLAHGKYESDYSHFYGPVSRMVFDYFKPKSIVSIKLISLDLVLQFLRNTLFTDVTQIFNDRLYVYRYSHLSDQKSIDIPLFQSIDSYKRNLISLIDVVKKDNARLILGNQAYLYKEKMTPEELNMTILPAKMCTQAGTHPSVKSVLRGIREFNNTTQEVASENNIEYIDLESQIPKNLEYFFDDVHYTEKGNQVIANALYEFIEKNNVINK